MLLEFGKANLIQKAHQQPDRVRMVLDKAKVDGLAPTLEVVRNKLDQPFPPGYCNSGVVCEVGAGVSGFSAGDRVASNGKHADWVSVPANLCARLPASVSAEDASFTVIGAVALQGIRLSQPTLGESFVVVGLGLVGLMTVQLLRAHGCRVLGLDFDRQRLGLAREFGAGVVDLAAGEDPVAAARDFSRGRGVDAVVITAATRSSEPVHQAALMCRKRGRIVLVGVTGLELSRADFYEKELSFQVSCSYGPGRYDPDYEEKGQDYPVGFVRWTAQRNFEAVLDMMAEGRLEVAPLISHRFPVDDAGEAYRLIGSDEYSLGVVLQYPNAGGNDEEVRNPTVVLERPAVHRVGASPVVGFVGAGNYASGVLMPAFQKAGVRLKSVASAHGVSSIHTGRKYGFEEATTDGLSILRDRDVEVVVVATRHDTHARFVCEALAARKHVFVEKPLALTRGELAEIEAACASLETTAAAPQLMVGFNRRFAPHILEIKTLLARFRSSSTFVMTVNAGALPLNHWTRDRAVAGGRIVGEACHFIDLLRFLAGASIVSFHAGSNAGSNPGGHPNDNASITLSFADGSTGTIHYLTNGHRSFPKERLEVFCGGAILQLDNFRSLRGYGWPSFRRMNLWRQDKGNRACVAAFIEALKQGRPSPIPFEQLAEVTRVSFDIAERLRGTEDRGPEPGDG